MKILFTRLIQSPLLEQISKQYEVVMWNEENSVMPRNELLKEVADADAIFTNLTDRLDAEFFEHAKRLKVVSTMAVGFDNIDLQEATKRGIPVGHTPDVLSEAVAELALTLMFACARRVVESMQFIKENKWESWGPYLFAGQKISGAKLGIIGMGRIGKILAKQAKALNMDVIYTNRRRDEKAEKELNVEYRELDSLLKESDYVVMLTPASNETYHMMGYREFSLMKATSIFVNVSRGSTVDEAGLYQILRENKIFAAGLDVFEVEPIQQDHPLLSLDNVIALPHIGSATKETRDKMVEIALKNILNGLNNERLLHTVNKEVY
ncbi:2-hydroxyacid dehydrogenase [Ureibacillus sinduriensis]|uniref:2-ketogluconate reductase n=1 Tax=Ureibacillus sinduriensis BLB-1 = JCM 15800 TaxID=1384057 RepID=A0A0A3HSR1_9BACL|nr:D-glycerate dehydrogenase [Ureibacillus sinduriensis]KGR74250.1 2-ketogluconate reductase [Ureibacillus sinduriensis BLB-1 = JCM 15800]